MKTLSQPTPSFSSKIKDKRNPWQAVFIRSQTSFLKWMNSSFITCCLILIPYANLFLKILSNSFKFQATERDENI